MTTREEYAEAANRLDPNGELFATLDDLILAARVLRQLAEGAVLCDVHFSPPDWSINGLPAHIVTIREEQP
jgi:hypothetical protein